MLPPAGLFSVALVVSSGILNLEFRIQFFFGRPAVSGLAALWCSDFPLLLCISNLSLKSEKQRSPDLLPIARHRDYNTSVQPVQPRAGCAKSADFLRNFARFLSGANQKKYFSP